MLSIATTLLTVLLAALKVLGYITIGWLWVFLPVIIVPGIPLVLCLMGLTLALVVFVVALVASFGSAANEVRLERLREKRIKMKFNIP